MPEVWAQRYVLVGNSLAWSAVVAVLPTLLLLYLLAVKRKPSWMAALAGLGATLVLAVAGYRMPPVLAVSSAAEGLLRAVSDLVDRVLGAGAVSRSRW